MYKQGDIVLIPVPFTDLSSQRKRPVIVILFKKFGQVNVNVLNRIRSLLQNLSAAM